MGMRKTPQMANVICLDERRHARTSSTDESSGRATSEGQGVSSGQRSENQTITSSYLRAVNVLPSSSKRSKKRQSPAAKRPRVAKLTDRAAAYAEAQAMRFDRSSVSMEKEDSRNFPTTQELSVGNFRLAHPTEKSDKSAMPTLDQIRNTITKALDKQGTGAVTVAQELGLERNHIRDFLKGDKNSLKTEVMLALSEHLSIPFKDLIISKEKKLQRTA
jgi:hypothetical protein